MTIKIFNYPISKRLILLILGDLLIVNGSIFLSAILRLGVSAGWGYIQSNPWSFILTGLIYIMVFFSTELYDIRKDFKSIGNVMAITLASTSAFVITTLLFYMNWSLRIGRGVFILNGILITLFIIGWRILYSYLLEQPIFKRNVLIVGAGWAGKTILQEINRLQKSGLRTVGFIDDDPQKKGKLIDGVPVLGDRYTIDKVIRKNDIDLIVAAITHEKHADLIKALINCSWKGVDIIDMPAIYEQLTGKIPFKHINNMWMLHIAIGKPKLYSRLIKPILEAIIALILFILLIPVMVILSIVIKCDSRGRIFYTQERIGKDGRKFTIMKFRTMVENAESLTGAVYAADNDPRITKIGRFLRKWRLDEIPQLVNVIKGDMGLIGPRPEREVFIREFEEKIPFYTQRLLVRPGLTGWAQVKFPYASSIEQTEEKLQYDLYYIKNMSFILDFVVFLKTIRVVLFGKGK
ncbi:MAG: sugar transferase [Planctomycetes bacterium]|uniref:sugar transferase n=1 Tax=Candidatus Wunengus sp. YC65 TaxID=3367701 RepID=UPI001D290F29|nr:sugar transferase [Planctomycetota bacterium]